MKKYVVIVAGGSGTRMGKELPKQFLELEGKPVLLHTIDVFLDTYEDIHAIVVLPESFLEEGRRLIDTLKDAHRIQVVSGGQTRFHSVQNGLKKTKSPSIIFIHDGVRCLVSQKLINACYQQALEKGNAIPAVSITDSVRIQTATGTKPVDRNLLWAIQTPQTFKSEILLPAFEQAYNENFTDEATVIESAGHPVYLIEGEKENIKLTLPPDLIIAAHFLQNRSRKNQTEK
ncbi:MAG: 2-C-methyl-D-erythritol 4-phosphate cytidylyltransferase [Agriterribacter sp.]